MYSIAVFVYAVFYTIAKLTFCVLFMYFCVAFTYFGLVYRSITVYLLKYKCMCS